MCTRYVSPDQQAIEREWRPKSAHTWAGGGVYPRSPGAFQRVAGNTTELIVGCWGLTPSFATTADICFSTQNARFEEVPTKASYKRPWSNGQRCIIPAASFDEPC